jgi:hypothetical protein
MHSSHFLSTAEYTRQRHSGREYSLCTDIMIFVYIVRRLYCDTEGHISRNLTSQWTNEQTNQPNRPCSHSANTQCTDTCKTSNTDMQAGSYSGVAKDLGLLQYDAVYLPTFRSVVMSTFSWVTWIVDPEDEGITTVRNADKHSSSDTVLHHRRPERWTELSSPFAVSVQRDSVK